MKKHSLSSKGLSLSQAQSISNLCYQRAVEIQNTLNSINNCSKVLEIKGKSYVETQGVPIPGNVVDILLEKARLHATQAFLMENIKAKDALIKEIRATSFNYAEAPPQPEMRSLKNNEQLPAIDATWGMEQLSVEEVCELLEAEAYAAHIGQFIHNGGTLDTLRKELPTLKTLEWVTIKEGEKTPLQINIHHSSQQLLNIHETLAAEHRNYESKVNYFKAKINNLVTAENIRRNGENTKLLREIKEENEKKTLEYNAAYQKWQAEYMVKLQEHTKWQNEEVSKIAKLRINVHPKFQSVVDEFLKKLEAEKE